MMGYKIIDGHVNDDGDITFDGVNIWDEVELTEGDLYFKKGDKGIVTNYNMSFSLNGKHKAEIEVRMHERSEINRIRYLFLKKDEFKLTGKKLVLQ